MNSNVKIGRMYERQEIDPITGRKIIVVATYWVGALGPFTVEVEKGDNWQQDVRAAIDRDVAGINAITS